MTDHAPTTRSYVPGEWYVVLGADLVLALPPDRRDLAASAWALVDAGAGADEVLDLVLAAGLSDLAGLALVSTEDRRTRAVVRGRAVCLLDADGEETVADGRSVTTWAEAGADDVRAISLELGSAATGATLEVGDGLVRAARACSLMDGRHHVLPDDIQAVFPAVAEHRLEQGESGKSAERVRQLLTSVSVIE